MRGLAELSLANLEALQSAFAGGAIDVAHPHEELARLIGGKSGTRLAPEVKALAEQGMTALHIAQVIAAVIAERRSQRASADRTQLVWTVGETQLAPGRQTSAAVRELFLLARERVLVSTYSIDRIRDAPEAHPFYELGARMDARAELEVRLVLHIGRGLRDERSEAAIIEDFRANFADRFWPGSRLPDVFFHADGQKPFARTEQGRACQHSKSIVVDGQLALITSANFSEAAHERNIELGVRLDDHRLAETIETEFDMLIRAGILRPLLP